MKSAAGSARNTTARAMSLGLPKRGTSAGYTSVAALRSISSQVSPHPLALACDYTHARRTSLAMKPGLIALAVTLVPRKATARLVVNASRPVLAAL